MKCIIVDDEPIARMGMARLLNRHPDLEVVASLESASEAADFMVANKVDIAFLDIQMPGMTGIEFARQIPAETMVVFTTAYSEYAIDSYEVEALDYLLKPIDPLRFDKAVEKARQYRQLLTDAGNSQEVEQPKSSADYLIVKADRRYVRLRIADILFVEGLKDYVVISSEAPADASRETKTITRQTIKNMEAILPAGKFLRVNKSNIVNTDHIDSFDSNDVFIRAHEIAIGASYRDQVLARLLTT